jgi:hypothetical protein
MTAEIIPESYDAKGRAVSPSVREELFGKRQGCQPTEDFENGKSGDYEDFSLYRGRQLMAVGYDSDWSPGTLAHKPSRMARRSGSVR